MRSDPPSSHPSNEHICAVMEGRSDPHRWPLTTEIFSVVVFSPDGRIIAACGEFSNRIRVWDAYSFVEICTPLAGHAGRIRALAFHPNSEMLASASDDQKIMLWFPKNGMPLGDPLAAHQAAVRSLAFSPDGESLISGSEDGKIMIWKIECIFTIGIGIETLPRVAYPFKELTGRRSAVRSLAYSQDGTSIASASVDGSIHFWNAASGSLLEILARSLDWVGGVAFSSDIKFLATCSGGSIKIWNTSKGEPVARMGSEAASHSIAFAPSGDFLISGGEDGDLRLWDVESCREMREAISGHTDCVLSISMPSNGFRIASASWDGSVRIWDSGGPKNQEQPAHRFTSRGSDLESMADDAWCLSVSSCKSFSKLSCSTYGLRNSS